MFTWADRIAVRIDRILDSILKKQGAAPYVTFHTLPHDVAEKLQKLDADGLAGVHSFGGKTTTHVVMYWASRDAAERAQARSPDSFPDPPALEGAHERFSGRYVSALRNLTRGWFGFLAIVAALGTVQTLRTYYGSLFARPEIHLEFDRHEYVTGIGSRLQPKLTAHNVSSSAVATVVRFDSLDVKPGSGVEHQFRPVRRAGLNPGGSATVPLEVLALREGEYSLVASAHARAGLWSKSSTTTVVVVRVLEDVEARRPRKTRCKGRKCSFRVDYYAPRARKEMTLEMTIPRTRGLDLRAVYDPSQGRDVPHQLFANDVASAVDVTLDLQAGEIRPLIYVLTATRSLDAKDWENRMQSIILHGGGKS